MTLLHLSTHISYPTIMLIHRFFPFRSRLRFYAIAYPCNLSMYFHSINSAASLQSQSITTKNTFRYYHHHHHRHRHRHRHRHCQYAVTDTSDNMCLLKTHMHNIHHDQAQIQMRHLTSTGIQRQQASSIESQSPPDSKQQQQQSPSSLYDDPIRPIPSSIDHLRSRKLHTVPGHPLHTLSRIIQRYFLDAYYPHFRVFQDFPEVVSVQQCFEDLLVDPHHPSRKQSDTYYVDEKRLLRTHMTAHDTEIIRQGVTEFLTVGDVYRRDTIDSTHYPVFHQMDGVRIFKSASSQFVIDDLKECLAGLAYHIFGNDTQIRWVDATFPFTDPSFELEVFYNNEWLEVLGCGLLKRDVMKKAGLKFNSLENRNKRAWAFGLGLERLAMVLFDIPDIRYFWSTDRRFLDQFEGGKITKFVPYSKFPPCYKDISFWIPSQGFHEMYFHDLVRKVAGDLVESVTRTDVFEKNGRQSQCYRIVYRSMDRSLTNEEIDKLQETIRELVAKELQVELR